MLPISVKLGGMALLLVWVTSCGTHQPTSNSSLNRANLDHGVSVVAGDESFVVHPDARFNSRYLLAVGRGSVDYFYDRIEQRNRQLAAAGAAFRLRVVDARDPRLYHGTFPVQPWTPATSAIVRVNPNSGFWHLSAWLLEGARGFELKFPTGGFAFGVSYDREGFRVKTATGGLVASINRNTAGAGWNYIYYLRGRGNLVSPPLFEQALMHLITGAVLAL